MPEKDNTKETLLEFAQKQTKVDVQITQQMTQGTTQVVKVKTESAVGTTTNQNTGR